MIAAIQTQFVERSLHSREDMEDESEHGQRRNQDADIFICHWDYAENRHQISVLTTKTVQVRSPHFQFELYSLSQMLMKVNQVFLFRSAFANELQEFVTIGNK
jgi:hypothetical protein